MALDCEGQNRMIFSVAFLWVSGHSDYSNLSGESKTGDRGYDSYSGYCVNMGS